MSENKIEKTETTSENIPQGNRGELGQPTPSLTIKQRWHEASFKLFDPEDRQNPRKRVWVRLPNTPSLKQFVKNLVKSGDVVAKDWLDNKNGVKNDKRSDANEKAAREAAFASRTARRKSSSGGKK
jgi:hypothetical protein